MAADGLQGVREAMREIRRAQRTAAELWRSERLKAGHRRFTDPSALRSVRYAVERVWNDVRWSDIETAIREHAAEEFTRSPWFLDTWARQVKATREEREFRALPVEQQGAILKAARR